MNCIVLDGKLNMESTNTDPSLMSKENRGIDASLYRQIQISAKYSYTSSANQYIGFYFITEDDKTWNQAKYVSADLSQSTTGDAYLTFNIDLTSNSNWKGKIYQLRFDPFNAVGTVSLDYIRFIDNSFKIINGDAEDTSNVAFSASGVDISIVEDSLKPGNHVYYIKAPSRANSYTYMRQPVVWTAGATYTIDYDIRLISMYDGSPVSKTDIICNMVYDDPISGSRDHICGNTAITPNDGWVHVSTSHTVNYYSEKRAYDVFSIYSNPSGGYGTNYQVDNIVVKRRM